MGVEGSGQGLSSMAAAQGTRVPPTVSSTACRTCRNGQNETKYHIGEIVTRSGANPGFSDCGSVQAKPGALQRFSGNCRKPRGSTGLHEE